MNQDRWNSVIRLFHAALAVKPERRRTLVLEGVNGDPEIQAEVESLVKADSEAGSYPEAPLRLDNFFDESTY